MASSSPDIGGETHNGDRGPRESADVVAKSAPDTMYIEMQGSSQLEGTSQNGPGGASSDGKYEILRRTSGISAMRVLGGGYIVTKNK